MTAPMTRMLACSIALLLPVAASSQSFDQYLQQHQKSYSGAEYEARKALFDIRREDAMVLNARPDAQWTAGLNSFSDLHEGELKHWQGYNKGFREVGSGADGFADGVGLQPAAQLVPSESHDWRDHRPNVVSPVKTQGACGSCWAFAAAQAIETHVALATGKLVSLSPQQLTSCTPNPQKCGGAGGCDGAVVQVAFNYTAQHGGLSEIWNYPYISGLTMDTERCRESSGATVAKITGYAQLPMNGAAALLEAVFWKGPVAISVDASRWFPYMSGIFDSCNRTHPDINHAVNLMGFGVGNGTKYWLLRNSWGMTWGEDGYMRLLRHYGGRDGRDEPCGQDIDTSNGFVCEGGPTSMTVCGECGLLSDSAYPVGATYGWVGV